MAKIVTAKVAVARILVNGGIDLYHCSGVLSIFADTSRAGVHNGTKVITLKK